MGRKGLQVLLAEDNTANQKLATRLLEKMGHRVTSAVKVRGVHTPIIAMTAHAMTGDANKCLQAGMDGYVSKPIRTELLFAEIDRVTRTTVKWKEKRCKNPKN